MSDLPQVEQHGEIADEVWGNSKSSGARLKLTSGSAFWILAPLFFVLPFAIYYRNKEAGKRRYSEFQVRIKNVSGDDASLPIPEISIKDPKVKSTAPPSLLRYGALQIIGSASRSIPPGSQIKAVLVMGASNGPVKAKTTESLIIDGEVVLESGATLLGQAQSGEDRLFMSFSKMVARDGASRDVSAQGYDLADMIPGLKGSQVRSRALKFAAAASLNFLGGLSEGLQETQMYGGVPVRNNSLRNAALNGSAHAALDQGKSMLESASSAQNVIEVKADTPLWIVFGGER